MICDFHVHSTFSDGTLTPSELVDEAQRAGVDCFALTDHDDVCGIAEARERAAGLDVEVMAGVEISVAEDEGRRQMHILGLRLDPDEPGLRAGLGAIQQARRRRVDTILDLLAGAGVALDRSHLGDAPEGAAIGRPHVARALVAQGICSNEDEAFARYLRRGRPAYVSSAGIAARAAIELIHSAGGMASLAHPPLSVGADGPGGLDAFVEGLAGLGLDGLEVQHPGLQPRTRRRLRRIARTRGLVVTGGSDFHGHSRPDVAMGRGRGRIEVGRKTYDEIVERAARYPAS
ncbi:MAG: PHP domain-containing protein [Deltaproteobacteria bacterium]|nr:PHP domain-containing protein [Deltaproteobacteria bacterium]